MDFHALSFFKEARELPSGVVGASLSSESDSFEHMDTDVTVVRDSESAPDDSQAKGASKAAGEDSPGGSQAAGAGDNDNDNELIASRYHIPLKGILLNFKRSLEFLSRGRTTSRLGRKS